MKSENNVNKKRFFEYFLPATIFIFSFYIRVISISAGPFHVDCLNLAIKAQKTLETFTIQPLFGPGYPLTVLIGSFFVLVFKIFGFQDPVLAVNFMSVVFSSLAVLSFFLLMKKFFGSLAAAMTAMIFSVTPIFLGLSVYGKSHTVSLFFFLQSLVFLTAYLETGKKRSFFASSIFLGLMGAARMQDMILILPAFFFLFFFPPTGETGFQTIKEKLKALFSLGVISFGVVILFHFPLFFEKKSDQYFSLFHLFFSSGLIKNFLGFFSSSLSLTLVYLVHSLLVYGLFLFPLGMILLFLNNWRLAGFFFLWILVPLIFYGNLQTTASRFFVILIPAMIAPIGFLTQRMKKMPKTINYIFLLTLCLYVFLLFTTIYPTIHFRHTHALLPEFAREIRVLTETNAVIIGSDESGFIDYYAHRETMGRPLSWTVAKKKELRAFKQKLDEKLDQNIPVYIHSVSLYSYDAGNHFSDFFLKNYDVVPFEKLLYEDWHIGEMYLNIINATIYKVKKRG